MKENTQKVEINKSELNENTIDFPKVETTEPVKDADLYQEIDSDKGESDSNESSCKQYHFKEYQSLISYFFYRN